MSYAQNLINNLVEDNLKGWDPNRVFYIKVQNLSRRYIIEYYRPLNYVGVILRQIREVKNGKEVYSAPVLCSYHDSCWKTDGTNDILHNIKPHSIVSDDGKAFGTKVVKEGEYKEYIRDKRYGKIKYDENTAQMDLGHLVSFNLNSCHQSLAASIINELVEQSLKELNDSKGYFVKANEHIIEYYRPNEDTMGIIVRKLNKSKGKYGRPKVFTCMDASERLEHTQRILEEIDASHLPFSREKFGIKAVDPLEYAKLFTKKPAKKSNRAKTDETTGPFGCRL